MKRLSETIGLVAGLAMFLGTLIAAEAYVSRSEPFQTAALEEQAH